MAAASGARARRDLWLGVVAVTLLIPYIIMSTHIHMSDVHTAGDAAEGGHAGHPGGHDKSSWMRNGFHLSDVQMRR